ncbi:hypothetical protein E6C50_01930 [Flavobacterium supellecticarium]|uniref:Uncharacterized protein n=1 Tax=Flavobacterium supellecticarium TaxID=2565924 RepID=A0A4S4A3I1_9FLAO|nr:hypothetical protein [Flavobacterium supellecticarium]THF52990.1 hypothetical protein E6C50_01930 [Flavobacterium supellecticarium]
MDISILHVFKNTNNEEGILLEVLADTNLHRFIIMDNTYQNGIVSNKERHVHWFSSKEVSKGDVVVLVTGKGKNESIMSEEGVLVHFVYWNLDHEIWNNDGDRAVLVQVDDFDSKLVSELK